MKLSCDKEGADAIAKLCDLALKAGGLQNMAAVKAIMGSIQLIEEKKEDEKKPEGEAKPDEN